MGGQNSIASAFTEALVRTDKNRVSLEINSLG